MEKSFEKNMARTVLAILPQIDKYCDGIAKSNIARAIGSFDGMRNTEAVMEKIIDKTYQIQQLHNLQVKAQRVLDAVPKKYAEVFNMMFIQKMTAVDIAKVMDICERSVFRLLSQGLEWFADNLMPVFGFNAFRSIMAANQWVQGVFQEISHERGNAA